MFIILGHPHSVNELRGLADPNKPVDRKSIPVAVIDDEKFTKTDILLQHDYNIREIGDVVDIKAVASYSIVLCDIKGVGKAFGSPYEGGHVIEEIKKYYPSKVVIAYTGQQFDPTYNQFFKLCDFSVKKDLENDDWIRYLDEAIKLVRDPVRQWLRTRERLIQMEIGAPVLVRLEDEYVHCILKRKPGFPSRSLLKELPADIKAIALNVVSDFIFKAMTE